MNTPQERVLFAQLRERINALAMERQARLS